MSTDIPEGIAATNRKFTEAFARGEPHVIAGLYTSRGQLLPPNSEIISGPEGIAGFWQFVMGLGVKTLVLETRELVAEGEGAVEIGEYTLGGPDGSAVDRGKYLVTWRNEGGEWKLHRDIWNTSQPISP